MTGPRPGLVALAGMSPICRPCESGETPPNLLWWPFKHENSLLVTEHFRGPVARGRVKLCVFRLNTLFERGRLMFLFGVSRLSNYGMQ